MINIGRGGLLPDGDTMDLARADVAAAREAIAKNREPECSGRNGAWAVEMVMGVYHAALSGKRVSFPLSVRNHALR